MKTKTSIILRLCSLLAWIVLYPLKGMAQSPFHFVCTDYVSTDDNRAPQKVFSYDKGKNTFSIMAKGNQNIAFQSSKNIDGEYTIDQDQTWFIVCGENISATSSLTSLWWINGTNNPGCHPDTVATNDGKVVMLWDLKNNTSISKAFDFSKTKQTIGMGNAEFTLAMGTTAEDQTKAGVITNVNYYAPYEVAACYPFLMDYMGMTAETVTAKYKEKLLEVIKEASKQPGLTSAIAKAQTIYDTVGDKEYAILLEALDNLQKAIENYKDSVHTYSYSKTSDGLTALFDSMHVNIEFYNDSTVRVVKTYDSNFNHKSWVVLPNVKKAVSLFYEDSDSIVTVKTNKLSVTLKLKEGLVNVLRNDGTVLICEKATRMQHTMDGDQPSYTITQTFTLDNDERIYGLGQIQNGKINERGLSLMLSQSNRNICIPYFQSSKDYALYWDNYSPTRFTDNEDGTTFRSTGRAADYYVLTANNSAGVLRSVRHLTGETRLPALWNFGFYQSKERYTSANETMGVMKKYRDLQVPIDCVVQDWQYWGDNDHWNAMDFLSSDFKNYQQMIDSIHHMHGKIMITIWPDFGPKTEQAKYLKSIGRLIPAESYPTNADVHAYDCYDPAARDYYWSMLYKGLASKGIDAYWLDSTEPDYFGNGTSDFDYVTGTGDTWRALRNVYPLATVEGVYEHHRAQKELQQKRVSIMTRSGFLGMQRTGAFVWSADITSSWDVLANQIPAACNLSVCGLPYWNSDTGGFFTGKYNGINDDAWVRLYQRWTQFSTFSPMLRFHGTNTPREIWQFGSEGDANGVYDNLLKYIRLRYHLLPYIYSTAHQIVTNGESFMNSLPFCFENDEKGYGVKDEYMFGQSILVAPVVKDGVNTRNVYLPKGQRWYDFWTGDSYEGGQSINKYTPMNIIPVYIKAGSIMPWGPNVQYSSEKPWNDMEIRVYPGTNGHFTLYEDEGDNYNYEHGAFTEIPFSWDDNAKTLTIGSRKGSFDGMLEKRLFRIVIVGKENGIGDSLSTSFDCTVEYDGKEQKITFAAKPTEPEDIWTDITEKIENPSFEADGKVLTNVAPQGWTVESNTSWWGVNLANNASSTENPLATNGNYIFGVWDGNNTKKPVIFQTLSNLEPGIYRLTVDMQASNRRQLVRLGKQCLFANNDTVFFKDQVATAGVGDAYPMQTMTLTFSISKRQDVKFGVSTWNAPAETWFKIDNFKLFCKQTKATAINVTKCVKHNSNIYNLKGVRINKAPHKGVFIIDGHKLITH